MLRLLSIIPWHVFKTPLEKRSIEDKDSDEKERLRVRGISAAEIGVEA
jgi:hypothetical protein